MNVLTVDDPRIAGARLDPATRHRLLLTLTAVAALGLGLLVYAADRDLARSALIPDFLKVPGGGLFGAAGGWLPSFLHAFGFCLLTVASMRPTWSARYGVCALWAFIDVALEAGQHSAVSANVGRLIETAFGNSAVPTVVARYFTHGTFDAADIAAAIGGAAAAALFLRFTQTENLR